MSTSPPKTNRGPTRSVWKLEVRGTIDGIPIHERFSGVREFADTWGTRTRCRFERSKVHRLMAGKLSDPLFDCTVSRINIPRKCTVTYESGDLLGIAGSSYHTTTTQTGT